MSARALVVLSTYNQPSLPLALRGWLRQTVRDFELVVADDGSGPPCVQAVRDFIAGPARAAGLQVQHAWHEDRGFRKTRIVNAALRMAPGPRLVIFTDGDCVPPAHFVERHLAVHAPRSFHVGGCVRWSREVSARLQPAQVDDGSFEGWVERRHVRDARWRALKSRWGTFWHIRRRPKVLGLNMAADRELLEQANGLDERFEGWGLEDDDLRDRLMRLRPRPRVRVLFGTNDVFHLWHPVAGKSVGSPNLAYYRSPRPARCVFGLQPPPGRPG